jgi:hypothetical protein
VIGNMRRLDLLTFAAPFLTTLFPATSSAAPIHFWNRCDWIDQTLESDVSITAAPPIGCRAG